MPRDPIHYDEDLFEKRKNKYGDDRPITGTARSQARSDANTMLKKKGERGMNRYEADEKLPDMQVNEVEPGTSYRFVTGKDSIELFERRRKADKLRPTWSLPK